MKNLIRRLVGSAAADARQLMLGRSAELPFAFEKGLQSAVPNSQVFVDQLQTCCRLQLAQLQQSLGLQTAALLWPGPAAGQLSLYAWVSQSEDLLPGPYPQGQGVTGVLREHRQLFLAPLRAQSPAIPYYPSNAHAGSFMAARLELTSLASQQNGASVLLCADRLAGAAWEDKERTLFSLAAEQLTLLIDHAREFFLCDRQRHAYLQAFDGLRTLNAALGLQSALGATVAAVQQMAPADFIAISLVEEDRHRVKHVVGDQAEQFAERSFLLDQGLVGQVIKYSRTLPEQADFQGTSPVFSDAHLFAGYRSLMILPLVQEKRSVAGALVVAARPQGVFSRTCREMLEMLAGQVAIKIELAQSHEQINRLATVDALTGIANRRAYQRGFETMLERAGRRAGSLHLILCDIDHFKRINDRFGHPFGDAVLCQVAGLLNRVVRGVDLAARTGGEEFAILLEDSEAGGAWKVAERLRKMVEQLQLRVRGELVPVTISLGIAAFPQDAASLEKLVGCADQALYRAKHEGRNRTVLWSRMADLSIREAD
jgi:diguanylate cyclase (GGDEF)-like protein